MRLFTVFEPLLIPDKAYPPLSEGNLVRLSFRMECTRLETTREQQERFMHLDDAEYRFSGRVALLYNKPHTFMIIEARGFRFYTLAPRALRLKRGSWTDGTGTLLLDYGDWYFHGLGRPSLLFNFRVASICKVRIPERHITRGEGAIHCPPFVRPGEYEHHDRHPVDTMVGQPLDELFYIMELDDTGLAGAEIPVTFGRSKT